MSDQEPLPFTAPLSAFDEQAALLLARFREGDPAAHERFKWEHPRFHGRPLSEVYGAQLDLDDARVVVAHTWAFESWEALEAFTRSVGEGGPVHRFESAVEAVVSGDVLGLRALLDEDPGLVRARSTRRHRATLLHYLAANGVEDARQRTPDNAVEVAHLLLEAGAEPDALADMYGARCTTMSLLVSSAHPAAKGLQAALAETLLDHGAALVGPGSNWQSALMTALVFGYPETAEALARRGAAVDTLAAAAGLGRVEDVRRRLPDADALSRHRALALAAQLGRTEAVKLLLEAGEDPGRYNPEGLHAHATPLHQAVASDHPEVVRVLVAGGAPLDVRDTIYEGTALDWAEYMGRTEIAEYLRGLSAGRATGDGETPRREG